MEFREGARRAPVPEAVAVVRRVATQHADQGEEDEADDQDDFAEGEPEFGFAVPFHGEDVDEAAGYLVSISG